MNNTSFLDQYLDAWHSRDVEQLMPFFAQEILYEDLALKKSLNHNELKEFIKNCFINNKELRFEKVSACITENYIAWEWIMYRTRNTGEKQIVPGMSMTEFRDGKVIKNRDYWSTLPTPH